MVRSLKRSSRQFRHRRLPNQPLQPPHSAVTRLACATRAPAGGRLNGGVRRHSTGVLIPHGLVIGVLGFLASIPVPPRIYAESASPFPVVARPPVPCGPNGSPVGDYRMSRDHPLVYLTYEKAGPAANPMEAHRIETGGSRRPQHASGDYWFRLHNNSVWVITVRSFGAPFAGQPEMLVLADGGPVFTGADGMKVAVVFRVRRSDGREIPDNSAIDVVPPSFLAPGRSLVFSVPRKLLGNDRVVEVDFGFEWEMVKGVGQEQVHRVEFRTEWLPR